MERSEIGKVGSRQALKYNLYSTNAGMILYQFPKKSFL